MGLDFARLQTPPHHGDTLVAPAPSALAPATLRNRDALDRAQTPIFGRPLGEWRRETRQRLGIPEGAPIVVVGHQPAFIHAGVWAKYVVAHRLALSVGGVAVNLIVDNDAPRTTDLAVPVLEQGHVSVRAVPTFHLPHGLPYEAARALNDAELAALEAELRGLLGDRFTASALPLFLAGAATTSQGASAAEQWAAGRAAIDQRFGLRVADHLVSAVWGEPLLVELLINAEAFHAAYNDALAWYRREMGVRGLQRPIPDLARSGDRLELPLWAYRPAGPRRRLFARRTGDRIVLDAEGEAMATLGQNELRTATGPACIVEGGTPWRIRPRALTLTLWARLLLADLFIHGIGGAKYDRITDRIIATYFGLAPPEMSCVTATTRLDFPVAGVTPENVRRRRHALRDLLCNPQRHLVADAELAPLFEQRRAAVTDAERLRTDSPGDRRGRRAVWLRIREANQAMLERRADALQLARHDLDATITAVEQSRVAFDREYFFALHSLEALAYLADRLPQAAEMAG